MMFASDGWADVRDEDVYAEELYLAQLADDLGFDVVWSVEHHFFGYAFCPDNAQLLTHVAAVTKNVDVGTAAVILPWHEPLRVAEKISMLDILTDGRLRFGMGRGASRREFAPFRDIEMDESRERFDEAAALIVRALETGVAEGDGPFYKQPAIEIRPRSPRSFLGRTYAVASSDDSIESAARLRAAMVMFADRAWTHRKAGIDRWRQLYQELHGEAPPPPMTSDYCVCLADEEEAKECASTHIGTLLASTLTHYELMGDHFGLTKGYEAYAKAAETLRAVGETGYLKGFMQATAWGTPDQVLETLASRREVIGDFELATSFRFGGIPFEKAKESLRLFATEVLPVLKTW
jgi:alkanesulfonate monooxygenase SsuD/methylene tetrahydromethanopterin reductase-like flavin-dependent oxidoreductase (luciferase family)